MILDTFHEEGRGALRFSGLSLDKEKHEYTYRGKKLSGITGVISKRLGKNFNNEFVDEYRGQGSHVHDAIEHYILHGKEKSVHPAARWAVEQLRFQEQGGVSLFTEVLITDKKLYASAIDLLLLSPSKTALNVYDIFIMDTKAGNFLRESVSWQLGVYKFFLEKMTNRKVTRCFCLSTKDRDIYPVIPKSAEDVKNLLYGARAALKSEDKPERSDGSRQRHYPRDH